MAETLQERRAADRQARESAYQRRRQAAQEAENAEMVLRGTRSVSVAEVELRKALRRFGAIRVPRGTSQRHDLQFLVRNVESALTSLRRAKRGSLLDLSDPDLAIGNPDLEG